MCVWCIDSPGNCRHERCGEGVGVASVHEYIKKKASTVIILAFNFCLRLVKVIVVHVTSRFVFSLPQNDYELFS